MNYARALVRSLWLRNAVRPGEPVVLPSLERTAPAGVQSERRLARFRELAGYPDDGRLPLTWPQAAAFPLHFAMMVDDRFPLPLVGTVHVRTELRQARPIGAGEPLRLVASLSKSRTTDKGLEFDLETRAYVGPELVWEGTATMLRRAPVQTGLPERLSRPPLDGIGAGNHPWQVPVRVGRDFARLTGDLNPIHLSGLAARPLGFKGLVAHGLWTMSRAAGMRPALLALPRLVMTCELKTPLVLPARAVYRDWPAADEQGVEYRVLDARAEKPHALGVLRSEMAGLPDSR